MVAAVTGVFNLGKMTHYLANGAVHVYSAFTREWASLPVSATANTGSEAKCGWRQWWRAVVAGTGRQPIGLHGVSSVLRNQLLVGDGGLHSSETFGMPSFGYEVILDHYYDGQ
ncbi:hypothetical protein LBMAG49_16950 [Planctomycetota bacterium]|nr:hypothetical protein LBMAG49_16950 [Planctomycetota bacterium]